MDILSALRRRLEAFRERQQQLEAQQRLIESQARNVESVSSSTNTHNVDSSSDANELQNKSLERTNVDNGQGCSGSEISHMGEFPYEEGEDQAHPFTKNHLVLDVIFSHLNCDSLKQCRLVNSYWKEICEPYFANQIQINFTAERNLRIFLLDFSGGCLLDCGRYKFRGTDFVISDFLELLRKSLCMLTSLILIDVTIKNNNETFSFVRRTNDCNINDLLGANASLKKLVCRSSQIIIPLDRLSEVEHLDLQGCKILYPEGYTGKISSPKYIKLDAISIILPTGRNVARINVNNFLNVNKAKEIIIRHPHRPILLTEMVLNLEEQTESIINCVEIFGAYISTNKFIQLKELTIECREYDMSTLPESLESLSICVREDQNIDARSLPPSLKYLTFSFTGMPPMLPKFSVCSQLKFMYLDPVNTTECDLSWLPPSVETLVLKNFIATFTNENQMAPFMNVKDLILIDCPNDSIIDTVTRIKSENIYLWFKGLARAEEDSQIVTQIYQQRYYGKSFRVGTFTWLDRNSFQNNSLSQIVDKQSNSYTFEEGIGKADEHEAGFLYTMVQIVNHTVRMRTASSLSYAGANYHSPIPHFLKPNWKIKIVE